MSAVVDALIDLEQDMNTTTEKSKTPFLDAALRKGEARGEARGEANGRRASVCETAGLLGAGKSLVERWLKMTPEDGEKAARSWILENSTKSGASGE